MFSTALLRQDFEINRGRIISIWGLQLVSLLMAIGICEMNLIEISDIFWDTLPVFLIPLAMQMTLAYELVQGRVQDKTMDFVLSAQISQEKMLRTKALFLILNTAALFVASAFLGCVSRVYRLPRRWDQESYLLLNLGGFCMQVFWGGFCFMISCGVKKPSTYVKLALGIPILQYLLYLGYYLAPQMFFLKYLTVFSLCQHSMFAEKSVLSWIGCAVCLIVGVMFLFAGKYFFLKRDYPQ